MAMSAKERMARWRAKQRADRASHELYKQRERERNQQRKETGQFKSVENMTPREKRQVRKRWRQNSREYRERKKTSAHILTPPTSPNTNYEENPNPLPEDNRRSLSMRRSLARKRKNQKAKCYRQNAKLVIKLKCQQRLTERYKKRYNRLKRKVNDVNNDGNHDQDTNQLSGKAYFLYKSMINNIRRRYTTAKSNKERRFIASLVARKRILKQYGLITFVKSTLSMSRRHLQKKPLRKPNVKSLQMKSDVKSFYERDDVSQLTADKKSTITRNKDKRQIRLLSDDLKKYT
ncbi:hypothetical protein DPMN_016728 [Dreissena polymorpha]|uniref:Uncharacterized protein n=1 Tax=Dreissena polymorpha TaxID=45954 RepID=A0A9D4S7G2_DREPO|nr:hypothetical protein DPMN_016728 [Dreissena polymorpha]